MDSPFTNRFGSRYLSRRPTRGDLREDEAFTARYPQEQPVTARIKMRDGTVHEGYCGVTKGEPADPHKPEALTGKFFDFGDAIWGKDVTRSLYAGFMRLEHLPDFRAFAARFAL